MNIKGTSPCFSIPSPEITKCLILKMNCSWRTVIYKVLQSIVAFLLMLIKHKRHNYLSNKK